MRAWLAQKGYDPSFGARPLARLIQTEIKNQLADEILFGRLAKGGDVRLEMDGEKVAFRIPEAATAKVKEPVVQG